MSVVTPDMTDLQVLTAVGKELYGTGWQTCMPPHLGISRSLTYSLIAKKRPVTAKVRTNLLAFCEAEPARLADELAGRLRLLADAAAVLRGR